MYFYIFLKKSKNIFFRVTQTAFYQKNSLTKHQQVHIISEICRSIHPTILLT
jgi:hypothetical protein